MDNSDNSDICSFDVSVDPTKFESQESDTVVTLPLLLNLPLSPGKFVNLTQVVGDKYFAFGVSMTKVENV